MSFGSSSVISNTDWYLVYIELKSNYLPTRNSILYTINDIHILDKYNDDVGASGKWLLAIVTF